MNARVKMPGGLSSLMRSEMEKAIYEANLGEDDSLIADRYLIDHIPQIDIAAELGCERSTISRRLKKIMPRVLETAKRLNN